ncbi:MAG: hypothetical protein ABIL05_05010 [candidate division WOR-3 bacterium]
MMGRRRTGVIFLALVIGGILGAAISFLLGSVFPQGPVHDFFFKTLKVGFSDLNINLGFIGLSLGFFIKISLITVIVIFLTIYLLYRL